jgi:TolA-binding protein
MAFSMTKDYVRARAVFEEYLAANPDGALAPDASYRRAYCIHALKDYEAAIPELAAFLEKFPESEYTAEALVLLGDGAMSLGDIDRGMTAYRRVPPEQTKFFEEAWFKIGKALRLQEKTAELREHMMQFRNEHAKSPRVAEALYWIGWVHRTEGEPDKAREVYWDAIQEFGNDPGVRSVDDLFPALIKLYKAGDERTAFLTRLRTLQEDADAEGKSTLAMRALWAQAQVIARARPGDARRLLAEAAKRVKVQSDNPLLLADIADALREAGEIKEAEQLYRDLLKWNPRAPQKDRAFAGLGLISRVWVRRKRRWVTSSASSPRLRVRRSSAR